MTWKSWLICQKHANIWHNIEMMRSFHPCCLIACPLPTQTPHSPSHGCRPANLMAHPVDMGEETCWRSSVWELLADGSTDGKGLVPAKAGTRTGLGSHWQQRAVMLLKINLALEVKIIVITAMR